MIEFKEEGYLLKVYLQSAIYYFLAPVRTNSFKFASVYMCGVQCSARGTMDRPTGRADQCIDTGSDILLLSRQGRAGEGVQGPLLLAPGAPRVH